MQYNGGGAKWYRHYADRRGIEESTMLRAAEMGSLTGRWRLQRCGGTTIASRGDLPFAGEESREVVAIPEAAGRRDLLDALICLLQECGGVVEAQA